MEARGSTMENSRAPRIAEGDLMTLAIVGRATAARLARSECWTGERSQGSGGCGCWISSTNFILCWLRVLRWVREGLVVADEESPLTPPPCPELGPGRSCSSCEMAGQIKIDS